MSKFLEPLVIIIGDKNWTSSKIESVAEEYLNLDGSNYFGNLLRFVFDKDDQIAQLVVCACDGLYDPDNFERTDIDYIIRDIVKNPDVTNCIPFIKNSKFRYWYSPDVSLTKLGNDWSFDT